MSDEKTLTPEEEAALNAADLSMIPTAASLDEEEVEVPKKKKKLKRVDPEPDEESERPSMDSPEWSDFVMRQFVDTELDKDGHPLVHGLRRVARLLLGPIIKSGAKVCQAPNYLGGADKLLWNPAVVKYSVKILMLNLEHENQGPYEATFSDVADVSMFNTDPDFSRHATATAATRAEARALRKALQITTVAAEERTHVPVEEASVDGMITPTQIHFIDVLCCRNDINVMKYVNATTKTENGKKVVTIGDKYKAIDQIPFNTAVKIIEHLSTLQNKQKIADCFKGYQRSWR